MPDDLLLINGTDSLLINGTDSLLIGTSSLSTGLGRYLSISPTSWREGDFSSDNKLSGTIYVDKAKTSPRDLTGLLIKIRIYKRWHLTDFFDREATIVDAVSGTWEYAVGSGEMPRNGIYQLELELTKNGLAESTNPVEFRITRSPRP